MVALASILLHVSLSVSAFEASSFPIGGPFQLSSGATVFWGRNRSASPLIAASLEVHCNLRGLVVFILVSLILSNFLDLCWVRYHSQTVV